MALELRDECGFHQQDFENGRLGQIALQLIAVGFVLVNWHSFCFFSSVFFFKTVWKHSKKFFHHGKFQTHRSRETSLMSPHIPITQLQQLLTSDHSCFIYNFTSLLTPFLSSPPPQDHFWITLKQIQDIIILHLLICQYKYGQYKYVIINISAYISRR